MFTTAVRKAPHAPSGRPGPQSRAASAKAPVAAKAKASTEAGARRRKLGADVAEALGAPPPPRAKVAARAASGPAKRAASTKLAAPAKTAAAKTRAVRAVKAPVLLPEPRQAPPKVVIRFPKLPGQAHAARYQSAQEQQTSLTAYRKFLNVARMVGEARRLNDDERHQIAVAEARINEIRSSAWSTVR